ncbi:NAD(P)-binding domain-containing protein [Brachybacterium sp. EF45031]|nr:NAD(P)-binding domain-containing protein [Brachybacterium sillae]
MTVAIIGTGNIGRSVAHHLVEGGESVVLANRTRAKAEDLAAQLGSAATEDDPAAQEAERLIV